ncbi:uncharacterized protein LOC113312617 [Papaver somniferum]|uniref:uncharacterized protein LOC113312617 n=1 Tax=Papaver somniferum TaxID=3469 RepID=UPI000E6F921D|nr:uncharacterized protein LOC113312617 [Papaver somniferum]
MVIAKFTFCDLSVSHPVSESTIVSEMISVVKQNFPYVYEDLILFGYTVDGMSDVINHDSNMRFFIHNCSTKWIDVLKFNIQLRGIIREDRPPTIISDCGIGLLKHVPEIFPNAHHLYYLYHMKGNIPVPKGKSRQNALKLFEECYTALIREKFYATAKTMSNIKLDSVIDWMTKMDSCGVFNGHLCGNPTETSQEVTDPRISPARARLTEEESIVLKKPRHDKKLSSLELIDDIRVKVMEKNYKRLLKSSKWTTRLTPRMQDSLNKRITDYCFYKFQRSSDKVFEIISATGKHIGDLEAKTYRCNWWQKHNFPCTHSTKAMLQIREDKPYKYDIPYYNTEYC